MNRGRAGYSGGGRLHERVSALVRSFTAALRDAKSTSGCSPRVALRSTLGYFPIFPPGRPGPALRFRDAWNQLQQQNAFMRLPWRVGRGGGGKCYGRVTIEPQERGWTLLFPPEPSL